MEQDIINNYMQAAALAKQEADKYKGLANYYSLLRLGVFALMIYVIYLTIAQDNFTIMAVGFVVLLAGFAWLVARQGEYERQRDYYLDLEKINLNEINSLQSNTNLYNNGQRYSNEKHFYSSDLDIFGNASLFQLINRAATSAGNDKLAAWLNAPADKPTVLSRQEAFKEVAANNDWKVNTQTKLLFATKEDTDQMKRLFIYLGIPLELSGEKWLSPYIKIAPYLLLATILAGIFLHPVFVFIAVAIAFFNTLILLAKGSFILKGGAIADKIGSVLANYAIVFKAIENQQWQSKRCTELNEKLRVNQTSKNIEELSKLINKLSYSLIMIVGFILNVFFLWALKQILLIEKWKRNNQHNFEEAFDVIAEFEALMSIAVPSINYPDWTTPIIADTKGYTVIAKNIAHPLIRGKRVDNDYNLQDAYNIDIITGSNMAGKSTFLRTIGINTVLALAGSKVCASAMEVSVITIVSYMRIKDSLNESTSTFKAELDRLQMLLAAVENEYRVFFLIDEMLRGTNSMDKYLGSKAVIEQLISKKGVGMVATHDLQIARLEDKYPNYVRNYYFDIQVIDGEMLFDYKIKHGECKTFNASLLLKRIGINVGEE
ncbi:DNA mismatch repair protein MutS [Mucilaginibacter terrigena]|uniref:DNA mismatch repair protein MutS n=1 Tax=Mucilaginibacter terrigena TaxID=2492395 RepID=A0A4Q5LM94_9SPHI|nr:DNA mismatch repair protein MutS [Mucilaginibacter terrigena]RYU90798.1 DNA mismatch repair protein MutS [Mucilaginibacter terrigena]